MPGAAAAALARLTRGSWCALQGPRAQAGLLPVRLTVTLTSGNCRAANTPQLCSGDRGSSIPGYPSVTVGYPTHFQKGGIDIPPRMKMLRWQFAQWLPDLWEAGAVDPFIA